jgi:hypothetical protein
MDQVKLFLDQENELRFQVQIEGSAKGETACRYLIESDDYSFSLPGYYDDEGDVVVNIPALKSIIKEGVYNSHLEVFVDDRLFIPLEIKTEFENSVAVVAKPIVENKKKTSVKASARLVTASKKAKLKESSKGKKSNIFTKADVMTLVEQLKQEKGK